MVDMQHANHTLLLLKQVGKPSMHDTRFLEGAVARYKGFLHLIKRNQERSMKRFCVPTYDIDLIWHSHQLQSASYCKDMLALLGRILEHDDTDADRTKGKKLDVGFSETTKQWEDTYGLRYWRAGAMYKGSLPSPLDVPPYPFNYITRNEATAEKSKKLLPLQKTMVMEVGFGNLCLLYICCSVVSLFVTSKNEIFDITQTVLEMEIKAMPK